ncbi:MAG: DUF4349 domain-containing protein [Bacteroidetes bacterium]|nr:DUF4349 domain-containing protein [Bacteroidota bacterium]
MNLSKLITLQALLALAFIACKHEAKYKVEEIQVEKPAESNKIEGTVTADSTVKAVADYEEKNEKEERRFPPPPKNKIPDKTDWDKKIIKTAELNIEVKNYKDFNTKMHASMKQFGGYVSQEEQNESSYQIQNSVVIKVPVEQFENAMSSLVDSGDKLVTKKITSEDVSTEVVDTKSRMEAKKQARLRYLDFMKQAKNMDEVLQVQNEIDNIQEELESASGRLEYLNHSSAYSTINLTFYQVLDASAQKETEPTYLYKITEAFSNGGKWIADLFLGLVALWPLVIVVIFGVMFLRRRKFVRAVSSEQ